MTELLIFPGIVVLLARGKEVAALEGGKPVEGKKDYKVEGHKSLGYDATVWLRMDRTGPPEIVGARSVHAGIRPGKDKRQPVLAQEADANLLEWLIFTALRCDPREAHVRDLRPTTGGNLTAEEHNEDPLASAFRDRAVDKNVTPDDLRGMYTEAKRAGKLGCLVVDETGEVTALHALIVRRGNELAPTMAAANGQAA